MQVRINIYKNIQNDTVKFFGLNPLQMQCIDQTKTMVSPDGIVKLPKTRMAFMAFKLTLRGFGYFTTIRD